MFCFFFDFDIKGDLFWLVDYVDIGVIFGVMSLVFRVIGWL